VNPFCTFMASMTGRVLRVVAGLALIAVGFGLMQGLTLGYIIGFFGFIPLFAGLFDFCVFAPLFGCPLAGPAIRMGAMAKPEDAKE